MAIWLDGMERWRRPLTRPGYDRIGEAPMEFYATPTLSGDQLFLSFARDTQYPEPALLALDRRTGEVRWRAPAHGDPLWGNVRSSPALYQDLLIYGEPYSGKVVALEQTGGRVRWATEVGRCMFPQWPSPAVAGATVVLPRHDGGLYALAADSGKPLWSLYLGDAKRAGPRFPPDLMPPDWAECAWSPAVGSPLFASPALAGNGVILVGTGQGVLFAIGEGRTRLPGRED
jgi:outer membrane protein assembly factor BamB